MKNLEVEGGELAIKNNFGDVAIIPTRYVREVQDMVKEKCFKCLDALVNILPTDTEKAQDGAVAAKENPYLLQDLEFFNDITNRILAADNTEDIYKILNERKSYISRQNMLAPREFNYDRMSKHPVTKDFIYKIEERHKQTLDKLLAEKLPKEEVTSVEPTVVAETTTITKENDEPAVVQQETVVTKPAEKQPLKLKSLEKGQYRVDMHGTPFSKVIIVDPRTYKAKTLWYERRSDGSWVPGNENPFKVEKSQWQTPD